MYTDPQSLSRRELYGLLDLSEYLKRQSSMQTDLTNSKKERKKIRRSIPLKNVEFMLSCFAKNIQLLLDKNPIDADDIWMSDLSEMEFLDSDSDAESDIASIPEQIDDDFAISDAIKAEDDEVDYIYEKFQKEQVVCEPYKRKIDVVQQTMKRPHSNAAVSIKPKPTKIMSVFQRLSKSLKKRR